VLKVCLSMVSLMELDHLLGIVLLSSLINFTLDPNKLVF